MCAAVTIDVSLLSYCHVDVSCSKGKVGEWNSCCSGVSLVVGRKASFGTNSPRVLWIAFSFGIFGNSTAQIIGLSRSTIAYSLFASITLRKSRTNTSQLSSERVNKIFGIYSSRNLCIYRKEKPARHACWYFVASAIAFQIHPWKSSRFMSY